MTSLLQQKKGIKPEMLDKLFPFYFMVNSEMELIQFGKSLKKLVPNWCMGNDFNAHFEIVRPARAIDFDDIKTFQDTIFNVKIKATQAELKGQMLYEAEDEIAIFVGNPIIKDLESIKAYELTLQDFAVHDPILDQLFLIQAQKNALEEVSDLANQLTLQQQELIRSNRALEEFAYIASHDLRAPLRTINSFAQLLQRRYKTKIDENGQDFLDFIVKGVSDMDQLVLALLEYSRVSNGKLEEETVDLEQIVQSVIRRLQRNIQESKAIIQCGKLPVILGNSIQIKQLFQNLLNNAIKFKGINLPIIKIQAKETSKGWQISVQDNGIGMDLSSNKDIFGLFQRLNTKKTYEGTGIGLAVCKKIVENHCGKIRVESSLNHGSTFYFTLNEIIKDKIKNDKE